MQSRYISDLRPATSGPARVHWVAEPQPLVEVIVGSHGTVRFVRMRLEEERGGAEVAQAIIRDGAANAVAVRIRQA